MGGGGEPFFVPSLRGGEEIFYLPLGGGEEIFDQIFNDPATVLPDYHCSLPNADESFSAHVHGQKTGNQMYGESNLVVYRVRYVKP